MEKGYNIYGPIIPYADEDKYPTHLAKYGKGGFVSLDNIETKDKINIPEERLEEGMLVYLVEDKANIFFYQYLGGEWTRAKLPNNISISTDLDAFKKNSAEGDITVYNNKFYYKDSEGNVSILPAYEFKELEDDITYNSTFTDENSNLVENSSIAFSVSGEDKNLNIDSSVKINLGDKTITSEDSESSISLPSTNGILALTSDISSAVDPVSEKLEKLISSSTVSEESIKALQEEVFESSSSYTSNYIHINPLKKTDSTGESVIVDFDQEFKDLVDAGGANYNCPNAKFLTVALGDSFKNTTETSDKTASLFLLISGKLTGSVTTQVFTDIVVITNRGKASKEAWDVRHVNDITCRVNNKNSAYSLIKYDPDYKNIQKWTKRNNTYIDLATLPGVSLDIKVIGKNFSDDEFKLTWYTDPVNEPDSTGRELHGGMQWTSLPSFTDSSVSIEIANTYKQQKAETTTISLGVETETKDTKDLELNLYNTFIIDCENTLHSTEQGALTFHVKSLPKDGDGIISDEDMLYNTVLRFVFSSTKTENSKGFDYFRITDINDNIVLDLSGLRMEDGESLYVTPVKNADGGTEVWSYYRESSFPKHDNTLIVKQDENKELRLGVNEETVSSQEKLYIVNYDNLINGDSGINVKLYEGHAGNPTLDIYVPKDAGVIDLRLKGIAKYLKNNLKTSEDTTTLIINSIKCSNGSRFNKGKKIDLILDFISPEKNDTLDFVQDTETYVVNKVLIYNYCGRVNNSENGLFRSDSVELDSSGNMVSNNSVFGFSTMLNDLNTDDNDNTTFYGGYYLRNRDSVDSYTVINKTQTFNYRHHIQLLSLYNKPSDFNLTTETDSEFQYWGIIDTSTYFTPDDYYSEELETLDNLKTSLE
jgi:hypothetical protein